LPGKTWRPSGERELALIRDVRAFHKGQAGGGQARPATHELIPTTRPVAFKVKLGTPPGKSLAKSRRRLAKNGVRNKAVV
jgi:hypothetical protein